MIVDCPKCNEKITIPRRTAPPPPPPPSVPIPAIPHAPQPPRGSLIRCKDCGHDISLRAASCPACRAVVKRANYAGAVIVLGIIAFFAIAVIMGVKENSPSAGQNPIKSRVGLTDSAVAVTNLDVEAWPRVTVYINGTPLDGYKAVYNRAVVPNELILIPFTEFARGDRRFNPVERKVKRQQSRSFARWNQGLRRSPNSRRVGVFASLGSGLFRAQAACASRFLTFTPINRVCQDQANAYRPARPD